MRLDPDTELVWDRVLKKHVPTPRYVKKGLHKFIPPIDVGWLNRVIPRARAALPVALAIQFEVAVQDSRSVVLTNRLLKNWGVTANAKRRALSALEKAGIIEVECRPGANPIVTLVEKSR